MHESSQLRMGWFVSHHLELVSTVRDQDQKLRVLDVGSFDVNGTYKPLFPASKFDYTGLDMESGPNVDIVPDSPYSWKEIESDQFDIVVSGQVLEHAEFFWLTMSEMVRVLKKGGMICIIVPNGFAEHRHPVDCYRFFTDGLIALARYTSLEVVHAHTDCQPSKDGKAWHQSACEDAMLIAKKNYTGSTRIVDISKYKCEPSDHKSLAQPLIKHGTILNPSLAYRIYYKFLQALGKV
jgi:SAM-dependent methyltransferase